MTRLNTQSPYTALIRTFNSARTLPATLHALESQSVPPRQYVFVDSGSIDGTFDRLPENAVVHRYVGKEFNYSEAINQGLRFVTTPLVLIISSHTKLSTSTAIEYAEDLLGRDQRLGAAYFGPDPCQKMSHVLVDTRNFTGFNGLWSTCALVRMELLKERSFRPEVFTAEDQEWAKWLFLQKRGATARIYGGGCSYDNPRGYPLRKRLNDYVAVAYYVNQDLLRWWHILGLAGNIFKPRLTSRLGLRLRLFYALLSLRLTACHFREPKAKSQYFRS